MTTRNPTVRAVKLAARDQRRADRQARRAQRRAQRRCFWTRPLGHAYAPVADGTHGGAYEPMYAVRECIGCGRPCG